MKLAISEARGYVLYYQMIKLEHDGPWREIPAPLTMIGMWRCFINLGKKGAGYT